MKIENYCHWTFLSSKIYFCSPYNKIFSIFWTLFWELFEVYLLLVSPIFLKVLIHKIISIEKWLFNKSTLAWTRNAQGPKPITQGATQLQEGPLPKLASYLAATLVQHFARGEYF